MSSQFKKSTALRLESAVRTFRRTSALNIVIKNARCLLIFVCALVAHAQAAKRTAYFVDPSTLSLQSLVLPPPAADSTTTKTEISLLHQIEAARTTAQVTAAQADDADQTIFIFRTLLGPAFTAEQLPLTAALSAHVHGEEQAASDGLKELYSRPRPYQADKTLHPVCKTTQVPNSYPSGHTLSAYLLALTLAEMVPEKRAEILDRAADYSHNRLVCGVHYPSDLAASRDIAYLLFGALMSNPHFTADLAAARTELRTHLGLSSNPK
jgi:acid phosphatase (class A)